MPRHTTERINQPISVTVNEFPDLPIPQFTAEQMQGFAGVSLEAEGSRLTRGINIEDASAKPLSPVYAQQKTRRGRPAVRDLRLTGDMLASRGVTEGDESHVEVGFLDPLMAERAAINEAREPMLGVSAMDKLALDEAVEQTFIENLKNL